MDRLESPVDTSLEDEDVDAPDLGSDNISQLPHAVALPTHRNSMLHTSLTASIPKALHSTPSTQNRLQHFRDARRTMTEGLLNVNEDLLDLASDLQVQVSSLQLENRYLKKGLQLPPSPQARRSGADRLEPASRKQFAVILLDADAYCFRHEYLVDGTNGGRRAADELFLRASEYLSQELDISPAEPIPLLLKAYANQTGLSNALQRVGLIKSTKDLELFVESLNQRVPLFDFANVGSGKERADNKIREWLQHYLEQQQCRHIILGCGHDTGYETFLQKFAANERTRNRITMLDGPKTNINFRSLGFNKRLALWTVFAPENLPRSLRSDHGTLKATNSAVSPQQSPQVPASQLAPVHVPPIVEQSKAKQSPQQAPPTPKNMRRRNSQQQKTKSDVPKGQQHQKQNSQAVNSSAGNEKPLDVEQEKRSVIQSHRMSQEHHAALHAFEPPRLGIWQGWWHRLSGSNPLGVG